MGKSKILVVGGAGFIGSIANKMLHNSGYDTVVFDNYSRSTPQLHPLGTWVQGDTGNPGDLETVFGSNDFSAVMHFGAFIDARESVQKPAMYYENNVGGTLNLLNAMVKHGVDKLIFSSTAAVYGNPQSDRIDEAHPKAPINPYGQSKLFVEKIIADFEIAHGIQSCIFRYFNAAGGDPKGEVRNKQTQSANLIPIVLKSLIEKCAITVNGTDYPTVDGTCVRDYIHVADIGQAHLLGMERLLDGGESLTCNLGNGQGFSVKQVLDMAEEVTGESLERRLGDRVVGDPPTLISDAAFAAHELSWKPHFPELESMIRHAWQGLS